MRTRTVAKVDSIGLGGAKVDARAPRRPHRPFVEPEDVAPLAVFLATERAANVTGSDYVVGGGLIKTT